MDSVAGFFVRISGGIGRPHRDHASRQPVVAGHSREALQTGERGRAHCRVLPPTRYLIAERFGGEIRAGPEAESPHRVYPAILVLVADAKIGSRTVPNGMWTARRFASIARASFSAGEVENDTEEQ